MKKGYIFSLILVAILSIAFISACKQNPTSGDVYDSTSVSATADSSAIDVDTVIIDTSSFK